MDLSAELKELRKQLYTYRYKSLELERQLRTHCHVFNQHSVEEHCPSGPSRDSFRFPVNAFGDTPECYVSVFTNSLIMEVIASNLPVQDLLRCRLVCKQWAREMAQYLTKRKALVVAYEDCTEAKELLRKKQQGKFINISTLCILEIPITSQVITDLVKNFGDTLSGLKLDDCNPEPEELFTVVKVLPCLEVLSFKQTGFTRRRRSDNGSTPSTLDGLTVFHSRLQVDTLKKLVWEEIQPVKYLERIIQMFPNLEDLELLCWSKPDPERLRGLRLDSLRYLSISCDNNFSEDHFLSLANLNLKLKKLTLHDLKPGGRRKMRGLGIFFQTISKTLTELNLNGKGRVSERLSYNINQPTAFPIHFLALQKFNIDCSLMTDFRTINEMPELQKLECKVQDWKGWWQLLHTSGIPKPHGKLLEISLGAIDSGCLAKLEGCFPTLTKLEVLEDRIDDVALRIIATTMPQLSHLRISASTNPRNKRLPLTDSGFTGIPPEECSKLLSSPRSSVSAEQVLSLRKHPYIGNLKGLYCLEVACSEMCITDVAVLYGISDLPKLTTITLPNCQITKTSLEVLGELPRLLVLELDKRCDISNEQLSTVRKKNKDLVLNLYSDINSRLFS